MNKKGIALFVILTFFPIILCAQDVAQKLQDISVTIKSNRSQGSGVIITRDIRLKEDSDETIKVNFVWTAAHVVSGLRSTRTVIDSDGSSKTVVEFKPASIVKELVEGGRRVGEIQMDAKVIKYSDSENGQDLALLMVYKKGFVDANAVFHDNYDAPLDIGTQLFHVGSLLGQTGSNSMTTGIVSQVGRVITLGSGAGTIFDQTTVTAFPGSSGGGVFLATSDDNRGKYIGMLVRGAGETFNLIVPLRRMAEWAKYVDIMWAIEEAGPNSCPTMKELEAISVEDIGVKYLGSKKSDEEEKLFPFLIHEE